MVALDGHAVEPVPRIAVVGAGPAGEAAAGRLLAAGAAVTVFDEQPRSGGNIGRVAVDAAPTAFERRAGHTGGPELLTGVSVRGVAPDGRIDFDYVGEPGARHFEAVVLACGARDLHHPVPGCPDPRVSSAGALQALLKGQRMRPDGRIVVAGSGPFIHVAAAGLVAAGARVTHVVDRLTRGDYARLGPWGLLMPGNAWEFAVTAATLRRGGVQVRYGHGVRAVGDALDLDDGTRLPFEHLGLTELFAPQTELARTAGCHLRYSPEGGYWLPRTDAEGRTSVPAVYVCGEGQGIRGWRHAAVSGRATAAAVAADIGLQPAAHRGAVDRARCALYARFGRALETLQRRREPTVCAPDATLCRCEGASVAAVADAVDLGLHDLSSIKSVTRCGMGPCQGRYCEALVARAIERAGAAPGAPLNQRAFVRPATAGELADDA